MLQQAKALIDPSVRRRRLRSTVGTPLVAAIVLLAPSAFPAATHGQDVELLSRNARGFSAEGRSNAPALSEDGAIAFYRSVALDLVAPHLIQPRADFYVRSRGNAPTTTRAAAGAGSTVDGFAPTISADGRWVAFATESPNLVDGDTNAASDIFIVDRESGETTRIEGAGGQPNGGSTFPRMSADGRWITFTSQASNIVPDDTNGVLDIFLYDRDSAEISRVSVASDGTQSDGLSRSPAISADGSTIAFVSAATTFVTDDLRGIEQVFVHDVDSGETRLASISSAGRPADITCFLPDLSGDGSVVAFKSEATNLVPGDTNGVPDVFVHEVASGSTERVSVDDFGNQSNGISGGPAISDDARYVAFMSFSATFDPNDGNNSSDVFVVDRQVAFGEARIERVSLELVDSGGRPGGNVPDFPVTMSGNGVWIGFSSAAENMVVGDINNEIDAFVACNPFEIDRCGEIFAPPSPTATPVNTPGPAACTGDCNGDGAVAINEIIRMTNMALGISICGEGAVQPCPAGDANGDCAITIEELIRAVGNSLNGCTRFGDLPLEDVIEMCCSL